MNIFPAIDIIDGKAVRLERGDYAKMTVYSDSPVDVAKSFEAVGAKYLHVVDLEGAKDGTTPNLDVIVKIISETSLKVEVGGGIRSHEVLDAYINAGVFRVILGTAAVSNPEFLEEALAKYGDKIAVGVDLADGMVAIKGWREVSSISCMDFFARLEALGVKINEEVNMNAPRGSLVDLTAEGSKVITFTNIGNEDDELEIPEDEGEDIDDGMDGEITEGAETAENAEAPAPAEEVEESESEEGAEE